MIEPPPLIETPPSVVVTNLVESRTRFRRTLLVAMSHWVIQAIICAIAQYDKSKLSEPCIFFISADAFVHLILLGSFAGMVIRTRFLFSWSFGLALLCFAISFALGYLSINFQYRGWFGPEFGLYILHFYIACACAICIVFWPIVGWRFELTRNVDRQTIDADQTKLQFSMVWLFHLTLTVGLLSFGVSQMYDGVLCRYISNTGAGWWIAAFCALVWLANIAMFLSEKLSLTKVLKVNIFGWVFLILFFVIVSEPTSETGSQTIVFQFTIGFLAMTFYLYLSALAYRWAGWRIVRFAGHNKSIYKQIYRFLTDAN